MIMACNIAHVSDPSVNLPNIIGGADRDRYPIELAQLISADFSIDNGWAEILLIANINGWAKKNNFIDNGWANMINFHEYWVSPGSYN
jgi:hypothetical protein